MIQISLSNSKHNKLILIINKFSKRPMSGLLNLSLNWIVFSWLMLLQGESSRSSWNLLCTSLIKLGLKDHYQKLRDIKCLIMNREIGLGCLLDLLNMGRFDRLNFYNHCKLKQWLLVNITRDSANFNEYNY